ncbi:hypothetical protein CW304_21255 [Bacillus sp. UFRGS-B20]|nr:hypothetical protein CW304_21255 [Bacillus sp. UFRGS-B20]
MTSIISQTSFFQDLCKFSICRQKRNVFFLLTFVRFFFFSNSSSFSLDTKKAFGKLLLYPYI